MKYSHHQLIKSAQEEVFLMDEYLAFQSFKLKTINRSRGVSDSSWGLNNLLIFR